MALWADIDTWIVEQLKAEMGKTSSYTTLKLASYHDEILTVPQQWEGLSFPAAFVESTSVELLNAEHGFGVPSENLSYRYAIAVITLCDSKLQAKNEAKTMIARLRQFIMNHAYLNLPQLAASEGEHVQDVQIGEGFVRPIPTKGNQWYGFALYSFTVHTHSGSI